MNTKILALAIKAEGGASRLARALNVRPNVVGNWKARGLPQPWEQLLTLKYKRYEKRFAATTAEA